MTTLERRLGVPDAVVLGLGAMLGAGVFVVLAPAAAQAGSGPGLLAALVVAGFVAYCNATSSARLAARYPESGGTYVYGRERLGGFAGFLAGWGFVVGKTASCAAMALTIGAYLWPGQARLVAVVAVLALTAVNLGGVAKTARTTRVLVLLTLLVLATVVAAGVGPAVPDLDRVAAGGTAGGYGTLTAAGLLFFAFAGYARIATLGEEVRDPGRTIRIAIPVALAGVLGIYLTLAVVSLAVLGPDRLAGSVAPLADVARAAELPGLVWTIRVGAGIAVTGVLLALLAGLARTVLAMARRRDLPAVLGAVHPRRRVPHRAELAVAVVVLVLVSLGDLRDAIGFSSFTVLVYYAITNASALTLRREAGGARRWPQAVAVTGLAGCLLLAATLPVSSVVAGAGVLAAGALGYAARAFLTAQRSPERR
ncbi:MAG: amino acid permease [Micromonosporaceae bacterium]|nr:amino acid permease [Micromonosporaceae bacterium]